MVNVLYASTGCCVYCVLYISQLKQHVNLKKNEHFFCCGTVDSEAEQNRFQIFITVFWQENAEVQEELSIMKVINKNWSSVQTYCLSLRSGSAVPEGKAPGPV